jgi:NitT/TauT family transport system permease protein
MSMPGATTFVDEDPIADAGAADARGSWLRSVLERVALLGAVLLAWEIATRSFVPTFWVGSPSGVALQLWKWASSGLLWPHLEATVTVVIIGYALGAAAGIAGGLVLGFLPRLHRALAPFIAGIYSLPKVSLAPLFIIFLGIGYEAKIALVTIAVFFVVLFSTIDGIRNLDTDLVEAARSLGATRTEIVRNVVFPGMLVWIFTGMRIAIRYAWTSAILGELIAANQGLGYLIELSSGNYQPNGVFAAIAIVVALSVTGSSLLGVVERRFRYQQF